MPLLSTTSRVAVALCILLGTMATATAGTCKVRVGGPCDHAESIPLDAFDHSGFNALLRRYVDCNGFVCYQAWQENCASVAQLDAYLHSLGHADVDGTASLNAELVFYINAYNALTIYGILREYPIASIQQLNQDDACYKIFKDLEVWIGGRYIALDGIENDVLRPLGDPRIHFALVCAARGCPKLRNEAYTVARVDWQLDSNAVDFFSKYSRFHVCKLTKTVWLSPILKWYGEDFGTTDHAVLARVLCYLPTDDRAWIRDHWCDVNVKFLGYDWGLNDQCPTCGVRLGRVRYCVVAKLQPCLSCFMPETAKSGTACDNCGSAECGSVDCGMCE